MRIGLEQNHLQNGPGVKAPLVAILQQQAQQPFLSTIPSSPKHW